MSSYTNHGVNTGATNIEEKSAVLTGLPIGLRWGAKGIFPCVQGFWGQRYPGRSVHKIWWVYLFCRNYCASLMLLTKPNVYLSLCQKACMLTRQGLCPTNTLPWTYEGYSSTCRHMCLAKELWVAGSYWPNNSILSTISHPHMAYSVIS